MESAQSTSQPTGRGRRPWLILALLGVALSVGLGAWFEIGAESGMNISSDNVNIAVQSNLSRTGPERVPGSVVVTFYDDRSWQTVRLKERGERCNVTVFGFPSLIPEMGGIVALDLNLTCNVSGSGVNGTIILNIRYAKVAKGSIDTDAIDRKLRKLVVDNVAKQLTS